MEKQPIEPEQAVKDFSYMLRQYGYRNRFTVLMPRSSRQLFTGNLNDCLNRYLAATINSGTKDYPALELETSAPYNQKITCLFKIEFDSIEGFQIRELQVRDQVSKSNRVFRLRSNHELPGSNTLEGLFPKPKPWDFLKKGKFRP